MLFFKCLLVFPSKKHRFWVNNILRVFLSMNDKVENSFSYKLLINTHNIIIIIIRFSCYNNVKEKRKRYSSFLRSVVFSEEMGITVKMLLDLIYCLRNEPLNQFILFEFNQNPDPKPLKPREFENMLIVSNQCILVFRLIKPSLNIGFINYSHFTQPEFSEFCSGFY